VGQTLLSAAADVGLAVDSEDQGHPSKAADKSVRPTQTKDAVILFPKETPIHV
jgi:hypothetical protein